MGVVVDEGCSGSAVAVMMDIHDEGSAHCTSDNRPSTLHISFLVLHLVHV